MLNACVLQSLSKFPSYESKACEQRQLGNFGIRVYPAAAVALLRVEKNDLREEKRSSVKDGEREREVKRKGDQRVI